MAEKKRNTPPNELVVLLLLVLIIENDQKNLQLQNIIMNPIIHKFDQDDLGLIERLYDNRLRIKDIFSVLNLVSSKYIHKPDVYNAISRQHQYKLQSLNEIEVLLKTLQGDENILCSIATKTAHNDEHNQDGEFIQAIFWLYCYAISQFAVAKDVLIIDATYKINRFLMPLIVICSVDQYGSTYPLAFALVYLKMCDFYYWLALITACFSVFPCSKHQLCICHDFKNIQNKLKKDIEIDEFMQALQKLVYGDILVDEVEQEIAELWKQFPNAKFYINETWMQHKESWLALYVNDNINLNIRSFQRQQEHFQKLTYETFLHQNRHTQDKTDIRDLAVSGTYKVLVYEGGTFDNEIHQHWYARYTAKTEYVIDPVPFQFVQAFNKLPKCHYSTFMDLMQHTIEYILKNGRTPELTNQNIIEQQAKFKTVNIDNTIDHNNLIILEVKHSHGKPSNYKCIRSIEEDKENKPPSKKASTKPKSDIKANMKPQLTKKKDFYNKTLGYDINRLINGLSYLELGTSQEYWFYAPECAQLASDTYNIPVIVFGVKPNASLLFLLFEQKPGLYRKPIVLQWDRNDHIVLIKIKPNKSVQVLPLNQQYTPISNRLNFSTDWLDLFI
ncbi:31043_t:CDS:2 [Gigaspora margarita]|uniref:31043_t:CDS:1 n=1 Tax=Gigaspora margarita TaxID=4874 RepID=A0ABN7UXR7_GIGMA|nr:31043_t:CDS:2 [Gigaspora margarita]